MVSNAALKSKDTYQPLSNEIDKCCSSLWWL